MQLERRYNVVYNLLPTEVPLNLVKVARWYSEQGVLVRGTLERAEPFTWLQHLDRRRVKPPDRLPWHLSALIVEEYIHAQTRHSPTAKVSEDSVSPSIGISSTLFADSQLSPTTSLTSSNHHLASSLVKKVSFERGLTFGPIAETSRGSLEAGSYQSGESSFSSLPIGLSDITASPLGNYTPNKGMDVKRIDEGTSISDQSEIKIIIASNQSDEDLRKAGVALNLAPPISLTTPETNSPRFLIRSPTHPSRLGIDGVLNRHRGHTMLPSADRISRANECRLRREANDEKAYELKARYVPPPVPFLFLIYRPSM